MSKKIIEDLEEILEDRSKRKQKQKQNFKVLSDILQKGDFYKDLDCYVLELKKNFKIMYYVDTNEIKIDYYLIKDGIHNSARISVKGEDYEDIND